MDEDVIEERMAFQLAQPGLVVANLVFIDEAGVNLSMTPTHGRGMSGERVVEYRPSVRTKRTSMVGAMTIDGIVSLGLVDGSFNAARFLEWLERDLLPELPRGSILVWDNVKFHFNAGVLAAVAAAGCFLLKMPAYSPDLNPIEECWSKLKHFIKAAKARTQRELDAAISDAEYHLTTTDFGGWIGHAGYPVGVST